MNGQTTSNRHALEKVDVLDVVNQSIATHIQTKARRYLCTDKSTLVTASEFRRAYDDLSALSGLCARHRPAFDKYLSLEAELLTRFERLARESRPSVLTTKIMELFKPYLPEDVYDRGCQLLNELVRSLD